MIRMRRAEAAESGGSDKAAAAPAALQAPSGAMGAGGLGREGCCAPGCLGSTELKASQQTGTGTAFVWPLSASY